MTMLANLEGLGWKRSRSPGRAFLLGWRSHRCVDGRVDVWRESRAMARAFLPSLVKALEAGGLWAWDRSRSGGSRRE